MFFKIGNSLVNLMEAFLMKQQEQLPEHWKEGKVRDTECQLLSQQRGSWLEEAAGSRVNFVFQKTEA